MFSNDFFIRVINSFPNDNFRLCQTQKSLQTTISNLMKIAESSPHRWKTLWEKEKLLIMSNFFFSHSVFKRLLLQTRKTQASFVKGLKCRIVTVVNVKYSNMYFKLPKGCVPLGWLSGELVGLVTRGL